MCFVFLRSNAKPCFECCWSIQIPDVSTHDTDHIPNFRSLTYRLAPIFISLQKLRPGRVSHSFSFQKSFSLRRNSSRPREIRDFTVPKPIPKAVAVSS